MRIDSDGMAPKWWQSILIGTAIIVVAAFIATSIVVSCGATAAPAAIFVSTVIGGLKIATVTGLVAGVIRVAGSLNNSNDDGEIFGESFVSSGKSFILGFSDGFLAGSSYAAGSMLISAGSFALSGKFNNGRGWSNGLWEGGYQTPNVPGISFGTFNGGTNGGRSFGIDIDMYNGLHIHTNKFGFKTKDHIWWIAPVLIGVHSGDNPYSEW